MEAAARTAAPARPQALTWLEPGALAAWALGFLPVAYLSLRGGGWDPIVRNEFGVAIWWIVLVGAALGVLPRARIRPAAWVAVGLFGAFALWTALAVGWSESGERSFAELTRVLTYLGVFVLAVASQGRGLARHAVAGVASAIGLVAFLAVLSRLHPGWFPPNHVVEFFPAAAKRLSYPLNSTNAVGSFMAIGLPLTVALATTARTIVGQALAAASVPVMGLCLYLTASRGGLIATVLAMLVLLVLAPRRIPRVASLAVTGAAVALLIEAVAQRPALHDGLTTSVARSQGDEVLVLLVIACAGVALIHASMGLVTRYVVRAEWISVDRRATRGLAIVLAAAVVFAGAWAGASGWASDRWKEFKNPLGASQAGAVHVSNRLQSFSGTGRYQYWQAALDTAGDHPIGGIGPGTFEFAWVRSPHFFEYAHNAHSLYLETLAETGVVGLLLLVGFLGLVLAAGVRRAFVGPGRAWAAAATAGCVGFAAGAAPEWTWQVPAIPVAFMVLAAAIVTRGSGRRRDSALRSRVLIAAVAVAAIVPIAIQLTATSAMRASRADARAGKLGPALEQARLATDLTPDAATPELQQALILERRRAYAAAVAAARRATAAEPNDWQLWIVRSRIEAEGGNVRDAAAAFARAHRMYPKGLTTEAG